MRIRPTPLLALAIPPLNPAQERNLLLLAQHGDLAAREKLVRAHIRYALTLARRYWGKGMTVDDYNQWAMVGLLDAIDTWDAKRNCKLMTHMTWRIKHFMCDAQRKGDLIRTTTRNVPKTIETLNERFEREAREFEETVSQEDLWFLQYLTPRERFVLDCRYKCGMTLKDVGLRLRLTKERVRQIAAGVSARVRAAMLLVRREDRIRYLIQSVTRKK